MNPHLSICTSEDTQVLSRILKWGGGGGGETINNKCDKFVHRKFVVRSEIFRGSHSFFEGKHQHFDEL